MASPSEIVTAVATTATAIIAGAALLLEWKRRSRETEQAQAADLTANWDFSGGHTYITVWNMGAADAAIENLRIKQRVTTGAVTEYAGYDPPHTPFTLPPRQSRSIMVAGASNVELHLRWTDGNGTHDDVLELYRPPQ